MVQAGGEGWQSERRFLAIGAIALACVKAAMKNVKKTDVADGVVAANPGLRGAVPQSISVDVASAIGTGECAA